MADEDYSTYAVKQHPELAQYLAQKTGLDGGRAWRVFRPDGRPHFVAFDDIESWIDLIAAPPPAPTP